MQTRHHVRWETVDIALHPPYPSLLQPYVGGRSPTPSVWKAWPRRHVSRSGKVLGLDTQWVSDVHDFFDGACAWRKSSVLHNVVETVKGLLPLAQIPRHAPSSGAGCWCAIASSARLGNGPPQHLLCLSPAHTDTRPYQSRRAPTIATSIACNSLRINVRFLTSAPGICCVTPAALFVWSHSHATRSTVVPTS